ncbi:sulfate transporter [Pseudomonas fluorescens]|uniref:STAS domain-containing protein n=1 Tax=Pseudomonas lactucae TaxID=2813360 RepID=A0A9X1C8M8_9PSED|nr:MULTISPECIES: STAS domain-containing protein [Pseudomonas]OPA88376.1 sulfate transporter [Pseudomonas fluorescens]MBN2978802.1 STAS domain-containing protein [Pseudomonas lactucae]MBN2984988.1 STAS domain-containing protein [Pseudomonas lactucae]OPA89878.1 sulfate transporter [Pseudomonas fluorescens]OPB10711.1 sulfate transporter [Pseudomonas fluorescens]
MPIISETVEGIARVGIEGELTIYTVAELAAELLPQLGTAPRLELDLSQVTEIDGAGLQLLAVIHREATAGGTPVSLVGQSQAVTQTLQLCGGTVF